MGYKMRKTRVTIWVIGAISRIAPKLSQLAQFAAAVRAALPLPRARRDPRSSAMPANPQP